MSKTSTLEKVEQEISEGKLGIARDRLHGLVQAFPSDLTLRSKLGDVYWKLGYPRQAGLYWFLEFSLDETKKEAVALFLDECEHDPSIVLKRLKLKCSPNDLVDDARVHIMEYINECKKRDLPVPEFQAPMAFLPKNPYDFVGLGCLIGFFLIVGLTSIGFITVLTWSCSP